MKSVRLGLVAPCLLALLAVSRAARATLPAEGESILTNDYSIDLYQGPVLSANRVIGLGGAYVAIADGTEGQAINPAATAARTPYSYGHFDYDMGVGLTFPSGIKNTDFWNSGSRTELPKSQGGLDFLFLNLALQLQFGRWGLGLSTDFQQYSLRRGADPTPGAEQDRLLGRIAMGNLQVAYSFVDGQLLLGAGLRTTGLTVTKETGNLLGSQELFSTVGTGFVTGFIWRPTDWQIRAGGAYRAGFNTRASPESTFVLYQNDPANQLYLPSRVTLPWDANLGFAAQLGPRPLNPRWVDPSGVLEPMRRYLEWRARERERRLRQAEVALSPFETERERRRRLRKLRAELNAEEDLDDAERARVEKDLVRRLRERYHAQARFYFLVTTSVMISGTVDNAVGIESMLDRTVQRSGERLSLSPRLGVETEVWPNWLKLRAGTYLEPSRFESNTKGSRLHATFGFDQKLVAWDVFGAWPPDAEWRIGGSIDASRSYLAWAISIGMWH